jgi:hypothetical protein
LVGRKRQPCSSAWRKPSKPQARRANGQTWQIRKGRADPHKRSLSKQKKPRHIGEASPVPSNSPRNLIGSSTSPKKANLGSASNPRQKSANVADGSHTDLGRPHATKRTERLLLCNPVPSAAGCKGSVPDGIFPLPSPVPPQKDPKKPRPPPYGASSFCLLSSDKRGPATCKACSAATKHSSSVRDRLRPRR